jgi:hypothetical protein
MSLKRFVGIYLDVLCLLSIEKFNALSRPYCALPRYPLSDCHHCRSFRSSQSHGTWARTTFILCKWAQVPVWLDVNLDNATEKVLMYTVEAVHAAIETFGTIE